MDTNNRNESTAELPLSSSVDNLQTIEEITVNNDIKDNFTENEGSPLVLNAANIANNVVGGGIISLPLAVKDSGLGVGLIMLCFSALACGWTIVVLGMASNIHRTLTYDQTVKRLLGKVGYVLVIICSIFFPMTGNMAYSVAIADNLQLFFQGVAPHIPQLQTRAVLLCIPFYAIVYPLSLPGNLKFLDKFSAFSIFLVIIYVITIFYKASSIPYEIQSLPDAFVFGKPNAIKALPVYAFACACHHNAVSFYKSLGRRTISRFTQSKNIAITGSIILYIFVAITGYVSFGGQPFGNIFRNYCPEDTLMNVIRFIFVITLILTAPLNIFASREAILRECFYKYKHYNKYLRPILGLILVSIPFTVGSLTDNLSIVIELGSAISNVPLVYIFPSLCAIRLYGKPYYPADIKRGVAWLILLFGILMILAGPIFTIIETIETIHVPAIPKYYCATI